MICTPTENFSGDHIENEMGGECSTYGGGERCIQGLVGKPEGMRPAGRPRRSWKENMKMNFLEVGYGGMDWIELVQHRDSSRTLVNVVMNLGVP